MCFLLQAERFFEVHLELPALALELLSLGFRAHGCLTDSAIVLLEHTCGFQQFLKSLLVET